MPRAMRRGAANAFSAAADREPRSQRTIKKKPVAIRATQRINSARTARLALPFSAPIGRPVSLFRSRQRLLAPWSSALQLRSRVWAREFSPPPPPPPPLFLSFSRSPLPPSPPPSHPPFSFFFSSTAWGRSWRNRARANDEEGGKKKRKKEPYAAARTERNAAPANSRTFPATSLPDFLKSIYRVLSDVIAPPRSRNCHQFLAKAFQTLRLFS